MAEGIRAPESGTASHIQSVMAAVIREKGGPFILEELDLEVQPRPDEVLVRVAATGICQTDVHVRHQDYPVPPPVVLGHEGAGVVERVGDGVTTVEPGDHVVLSYQACGHCRSCLSGHQPYCQYAFEINFGAARLDGSNALRAKREQGGGEIHGHFFGQSSFATYALATERNVVKVPYAPKQKVLAAIDIISPGWSAFKHCDASENIRGWVEAHDQILEYDFTAVVSGHVNRWGTREDAIASREYTNDIVAFSREALAQVSYQELVERIGFSNVWVLWENYFNEMTNYVTKKTLEKVSSNGQIWAQRLAGADVMTKYHAYSILEALRLEWGVMSKLESDMTLKARAQTG